MELATQIFQFVLSISILVVLHELGHYLPAKWFKCRVEKFYLFFDPWFSLVKKKIGETEYGIGWLPLGGYVKISGMVDESMDTEQLKQPAQPWEFRSKPAWQRLIIMLGGIFVNLILAWTIYTCLNLFVGEKYHDLGKFEIRTSNNGFRDASSTRSDPPPLSPSQEGVFVKYVGPNTQRGYRCPIARFFLLIPNRVGSNTRGG